MPCPCCGNLARRWDVSREFGSGSRECGNCGWVIFPGVRFRDKVARLKARRRR